MRGKVESVFGISVRAVMSPPYYLTLVHEATDFLCYIPYLSEKSRNPGFLAEFISYSSFIFICATILIDLGPSVASAG